MRPTMHIFHLAGSVLHYRVSFIISFTHVGQISFQSQPNAICAHVGCHNFRHKVDSMTTQPTRKRVTFIKVALIMFPIISLLTATTFYILYTNFGLLVGRLLLVLLLPGMLFYAMVTGDVHLGQKTAGMIVTGLGTWIFWSFIFYFFYNRRKK
jgi:hypothetical protein